MAILNPAILLRGSWSSTARSTVVRCFLRAVGVYQQQVGLCSTSARPAEKEHTEMKTIFHTALNHVDRVAIADGFGTHTYREILAKSLQLAQRIREKLGEGRVQERVVFLCQNDVSYVITQWACWAAGHIAVPLSAIHPASVLCYYIEDSDAALAITCEGYTQLMCSVVNQTQNHQRLPVLVLEDSWCSGGTVLKPQPFKKNDTGPLSVPVLTTPPVVDEQLNAMLDDHSMPSDFYRSSQAMILYTSGTTGKPKGVLLSHTNVDAQVQSLVRSWAWSPTDVIVHTLPLHHTHGIVNALLCPLYVGARCIMLPRFDAASVWSNLLGVNMSASERPTVFMAVPTIYTKLVEEYEKKIAANARLREYVKVVCSTKVRLMVSGSAPLPEPLFDQWHSITGHYLLERYGMTEIGMALSNPLKGKRKPGHVGFPLPDVRVRIAEFRSAADGTESDQYDIVAEGNFKATKVQPGKAGVSGQLLIRGPSVFHGYWNRPEATDKEFTKDGWFKTGDIAVYHNGYYKILGRASADIIKSGGYKISALQIETELLAHSQIADCAVVGLSDDIWGQKVAAVVVVKGGEKLDVKALRSWCKDRMAPYTVPSEWRMVDSLPRNAMGKVNKLQLVKSVFP